MTKKARPAPIRPADAAKGAAAEVAFRQWLDASELPHLYIEQSPLTVPAHLRGKLKRVDNLVGIPGVGLVAFDVKAKTIYPEGLIFDLDEVRGLRTFARLFHLTVFFACLDPEGGDQGFWVRLDQLDFAKVSQRAGKATVCCPIDKAMPVSMSWNFYDAFFDALKDVRGRSLRDALS